MKMQKNTILILITFLALVPYKFGASLDIISTAVSLVHSAEKPTPNNNICKTWIFAISKNEETEGRDNLEHFSITNQLNEFRTQVILIESNADQYMNISLNQEYTFNDIVNFTFFKVSKYIPHCQVVFILAESLLSFIGMAKLLISRKLSRPHRDYTLILGNSEAVTEYFSSQMAQEFRHKYSVKFTHDRSLEISDFCKPNSNGSLELFERSCNPILNGRHFLVSAVLGTPYIRFQNKPDGSLRWGQGIYFELLHDSSLKFNYTFTLFGANSRGSSGFKRDGIWHGAMGDVFLRRADFSVGAGITVERDSVVDNGVPFEWNPRVFFVRSPPLKTSWKAVFWPFDSLVWGLILVTPVLIVPAYYLSVRYYYNVQPTAERSQCIVGDVVGNLVAIILDQSTTARRWIGFRIRFLIVLWMIFCIVMGAGYRSRLINFLTFIVPDQVPTTHRELIEEGYTLFFRFYGGIAYRYAATSLDPIQKAVTSRAVLINSSQECIIMAALTEKSACLDWEFHGDYATFTNATPHVRQNPGEQLVLKSRDAAMTIMVAWVYRKLSPLAETLDRYILQTFSTGLYMNWLDKDWTKSKVEGARWMNQQKNSPAQKKMLAHFRAFSANPKPLQFSSLYGLFSLSGVCLLFTLVIWILEISLHCIHNARIHDRRCL